MPHSAAWTSDDYQNLPVESRQCRGDRLAALVAGSERLPLPCRPGGPGGAEVSFSSRSVATPRTQARLQSVGASASVSSHVSLQGRIGAGPISMPSACESPLRGPPHVRQTSSAVSSRLGPNGSHRAEPAHSAAAQDPAVTGAVRLDFERLEARLTAEMSSVREAATRMLQTSEKVWQAEVARLDEKLAIHDTLQTSLQHRVAEISITLKDLSTEIGLNAARVDSAEHQVQELKAAKSDVHPDYLQLKLRTLEEMSPRLTEMQARLEALEVVPRINGSAVEEKQSSARFRQMEQRLIDFEQQVQDLNAAKSLEVPHDLQKRIQSLEETEPRLAEIQARVEALEEPRLNGSVMEEKENPTRVWQMEQRLADIVQQVDQLATEARGEGGWGALIQEHEVRINSLKCKLQSQDTSVQTLEERMRQDFEGRLERLRKNMQEMSASNHDIHARMEVLSKQEPIEVGRSVTPLPLTSVWQEFEVQAKAISELRNDVADLGSQVSNLQDTLTIEGIRRVRKDLRGTFADEAAREATSVVAEGSTGNGALPVGNDLPCAQHTNVVEATLAGHPEEADQAEAVDGTAKSAEHADPAKQDFSQLQTSLQTRIASIDTLLLRVETDANGAAHAAPPVEIE